MRSLKHNFLLFAWLLVTPMRRSSHRSLLEHVFQLPLEDILINEALHVFLFQLSIYFADSRKEVFQLAFFESPPDRFDVGVFRIQLYDTPNLFRPRHKMAVNISHLITLSRSFEATHPQNIFCVAESIPILNLAQSRAEDELEDHVKRAVLIIWRSVLGRFLASSWLWHHGFGMRGLEPVTCCKKINVRRWLTHGDLRQRCIRLKVNDLIPSYSIVVDIQLLSRVVG